MSQEINFSKIVVFTGAGISAESGIQTYRDSDGLWQKTDGRKVASTESWRSDPKALLDFFNARMTAVKAAEPNQAHHAVQALEKHFEVVVITQNIDDLHERAGSSNVIHLHGSMLEAYPDGHPEAVQKRGLKPIQFGETNEDGRQIRPNVVLFGEGIHHYEEAKKHLQTAGKVLVVGTSLMVEPAASLLKKSRYEAERILISKAVDRKPYGFEILRGLATELVPTIVNNWIKPHRDQTAQQS